MANRRVWHGGRIMMTEERRTTGAGKFRLLMVFGKPRYLKRGAFRINQQFTNVRMRR